MTDIVLTTLNAKYIHCAFGLRYLLANLQELEPRASVHEFTIAQRPLDIAEQLLKQSPRIIGFSVYIWNSEQTYAVMRLVRTLAPHIKLVIGGPEVSYEYEDQAICQFADHTVLGPGEGSFYTLCKALLYEQTVDKTIASVAKPFDQLTLPYYLYSDDDLRNRIVYVEASRGCPFKCSFCLSALDKTAKALPLTPFLEAMQDLYDRGLRHFKFVDRTFNLSIKVSLQILDFFLERLRDDLFLHFEVIPDRLPEPLKAKLRQFPPGILQFEVGIQTFNPEVQQLILRKQDNAQSRENLSWLRQHTHAHLHTDLIFGLPSEDWDSCQRSFDQLHALEPHEIQVGILKRLKGMPMAALEQAHELLFSPITPFEVLQTKVLPFAQLQRLKRFARYWDLIGNSGRFQASLRLLLRPSPFQRFMQLCDYFFEHYVQTHQINQTRLFDWLYDANQNLQLCDQQLLLLALTEDYSQSALKKKPQCLLAIDVRSQAMRAGSSRGKRQQQHLVQSA